MSVSNRWRQASNKISRDGATKLAARRGQGKSPPTATRRSIGMTFSNPYAPAIHKDVKPSASASAKLNNGRSGGRGGGAENCAGNSIFCRYTAKVAGPDDDASANAAATGISELRMPGAPRTGELACGAGTGGAAAAEVDGIAGTETPAVTSGGTVDKSGMTISCLSSRRICNGNFCGSESIVYYL